MAEKRVAARPAKVADAVNPGPLSVEPTEADYEKARTVGIGNEPELPAGKVENGRAVRARAAAREH